MQKRTLDVGLDCKADGSGWTNEACPLLLDALKAKARIEEIDAHVLRIGDEAFAVDTRLSDAIGKFDSQHKENVAHLDDLGGRLGELEVQVRTANGLPLGELADRVEGRDIERNIPPEKRTEMEQSYVDRLHPEEETK